MIVVLKIAQKNGAPTCGPLFFGGEIQLTADFVYNIVAVVL